MDYNGWLFITDMDGTLLDKNNGISDENAAAIRGFIDRGGMFSIASGRDHKDLKSFFKKIKPTAPVVCMNGSSAYDYDKDEEIFSLDLNKSAENVILDIYKNLPQISIALHTEQNVFICHQNDSTQLMLDVIDFTPAFVDGPSDVKKPWIKSSLWGSDDEIRMTIDYVKKLDCEKDFNIVQAYTYSCEILNKNADKWFGVKKIKELSGGKIKKIASIGDFENDLMMIKNADVGFAPSNACDKTKSAADFVLDEDCNHSAIAAAINKLYLL